MNGRRTLAVLGVALAIGLMAALAATAAAYRLSDRLLRPARLQVSPGQPRTPAQIGIAVRQIMVPDPLGPMPAWYLAGGGRTWVIVVHGLGHRGRRRCRCCRCWSRAGCRRW